MYQNIETKNTHKIYSRKRICFPRSVSNKNNGKNLKKGTKIFVIIFIAFLVVIIISKAVSPVFDTLCKDEAKSIATVITNEQATNVMKEYSYDELFTIEKDSNGNITMIKSNVFPINEIISSIAVKIQEEINNEGKDKIKIALGTFTGIKIFSGRGPYVNIKVSSIGNVETNLKSEFTEQGINQTLHRVYLQVKCQISILTPFSNTEEEIENQVLIAENVIVGQIPSTYYNLDGLENSDALEIMN